MIRSFGEKYPQICESAYIDPAATVIGAVTIGENVSVWPGAVLRGDEGEIIIGEGANIQDNVTIHNISKVPVIVGKNVTVGHNAVLHSCTIEDNCLIGMNSVVLDYAKIQKNSMVAAGALIAPRKTFPEGSLIKGSPGAVVRELADIEIKGIVENAFDYMKLAAEYKNQK